MNRIDRLSAIIIMLQSSSSIKTRQIADRFNISLRTVYRDIKALEDAGIPIASDTSAGYSLVEGFKLPPLMFTQDEGYAFLAAEELVNQFTDSGLKKSYKSGIEKIRAVMRLAERKTIEELDNKIDSTDFHYHKPSSSQNILQAVMNAVAEQKKIQISYFSYNNQEKSNRVIDPIGIFFSLSNWYLIAYCNTRKDYRMFHINRIEDIIKVDKDFEIEHPSLNSFLKSLTDKKDLKEVIIEISKHEFSLIDESRYYQGLIAEKEIGDNIELHFLVFSIKRFARWYLSYVDIAKIIYPEELQIEVNAILDKVKTNF